MLPITPKIPTVAAKFNLAKDTLQQRQEALNLSFEFDKNHLQPPFQPGDTVFVETSQQNLLHKKFDDQFNGPYKVLELLHNKNLKLVPLNNGPLSLPT